MPLCLRKESVQLTQFSRFHFKIFIQAVPMRSSRIFFSLTHEREFQFRVRNCFRVSFLLRLGWSGTLRLILEQIVQAIISRSSQDHLILKCYPIGPSCCHPMEHPFYFVFVYFSTVMLRLSKDSQLASDRKEIISLR